MRMTGVVGRSHDLAAELAFWEALGARRLWPPGDHEAASRVLNVDLGGMFLEIHRRDAVSAPADRADVRTALSIQVDDIEAAVDRAQATGGTLIQEIRPEGNGKFAYVASPGGQAVCLVQADAATYRSMLGMQPMSAYWPA